MTVPGEGRIARFWDARAVQYDAHYDTVSPDGYALRARRDLATRLLGDGPGAVLDAGMGAGRLCEALAARRWTVVGVDASAEMVALARERLPGESDRLLQGSLEELPFPDASFDAAAATGVLEYTDVPRALAEVARVLRPGGTAVVSYPNPKALYALWKTEIWYRLLPLVKGMFGRSQPHVPKGGPALTPKQFTSVLSEAGLRLRSVHYTAYILLPSPLDELLPAPTAALGGRLEGARPSVGRVLATQVLYSATKPGDAEQDVSGADRRGGRTD